MAGVNLLDAKGCLKVHELGGTPSFVLFPHLFKRLTKIVGLVGSKDSRLSLAYPIKAMPLAYWLRTWRTLAKYAEASSECELELALKCGFSSKRIIVSGPGKAAWMKSKRLQNLTVVFDSLTEARLLIPIAVRCNWRVGLEPVRNFVCGA